MSGPTFAWPDAALFAGYFLVTLFVGFRSRGRSDEDFLIASRRLSLPVFVATLVATWYGGILAAGEFTYQMGLGYWTTQALPYYAFGVVFALFLAKRVCSARLYTIPDLIEREHGKPAAILGSLFTFLLASPAPYVLMVGQIVSFAFGWPLFPSILLGTVFSTIYTFAGGFLSDVRINLFQFGLMFGGFAVALPFFASHAGGYAALAQSLPSSHLRLDGGLPADVIVVWFFIALWTLVDPGFHQRCSAASSPKVAQIGVLLAVLCWATFDFLTTSTGLFARASLPNLPQERQLLAFPLFAEEVLPPVVKGLFYIAMLATVMSTVVSYTFLGGITLGRDVAGRFRRDLASASVARWTRSGLFLTTVAAIAVALAVPSVVRQWYALGTVCVPGLLVAVLSGYAPSCKAPPSWTFASMAAGFGVSLGCLLIGWSTHGLFADTGQFPFATQPMYPGLVASALLYGAGYVWSRLRMVPKIGEGRRTTG